MLVGAAGVGDKHVDAARLLAHDRVKVIEVRRVFDDYCGSVVDAVSRQLRGNDADAYARLSAHVHAVAAAAAADAAHRGCLLAKGAAELAEHDETVAKRARAAIEALLEDELVLAVLRGIEALGKAGASEETLTDIASTALAVLPRPAHRASSAWTPIGGWPRVRRACSRPCAKPVALDEGAGDDHVGHVLASAAGGRLRAWFGSGRCARGGIRRGRTVGTRPDCRP